jgi:hypothetical protein
MKHYLTLLILTLTGLLLVACGDKPLPIPDASRSMTATPTMLLAATVVGLPLARISEQVGETEKEAQVSLFGVSGDKS